MRLTDDGIFSFSSFLPILYCYLRENFFFLHSLDLRSIENVPFLSLFVFHSRSDSRGRVIPLKSNHSFIVQPLIPHHTAEHRIPFLVRLSMHSPFTLDRDEKNDDGWSRQWDSLIRYALIFSRCHCLHHHHHHPSIDPLRNDALVDGCLVSYTSPAVHCNP